MKKLLLLFLFSSLSYASMGTKNTNMTSISRKKLDITKTLSANNASAVVALFKVKGHVNILKLGGILIEKTVLANMTGVHFNTTDGTVTSVITKNDGVMSTALVGAVVQRLLISTSTASILLPTGVNFAEINTNGYPFFIVAKNGVDTYINFLYTTTDAPMNAKMQFFVEYESLTGGYLEAI